MSYITVNEYMQYAGITSLDTTTSSRVSILLDSTKAEMDNLIWDLTLNQKTEQIRYCDVVCNRWYYDTIVCWNIEIKSLDEINNTSYTWVLNIDYQIIKPLKSRIVIKDLVIYINGLVFDYFDITYTSWYSVIPNDIKYLQYLLVSGELAKQSGKEIKSYTLWPRQFTFSDTNSLDTAKKTISNYSLIYL